MAERTGEKIGWIGGWLGGFIWVFILSGVFLYQGKTAQGAIGLAVVALAVFSILFFAPWRYPSTGAWKLMLAPYLALFASLVWAVWAYGSLEKLGLSRWNASLILLLLLPFFTGGKRKWRDGNPKQAAKIHKRP